MNLPQFAVGVGNDRRPFHVYVAQLPNEWHTPSIIIACHLVLAEVKYCIEFRQRVKPDDKGHVDIDDVGGYRL